ncbi:MAG: hypothetical protein ACYCVD_09470 [Desulfitobacteriaceae bacterium]
MNNDVAIIEGVYDIVLPEVPASPHRWGRVVWLYDIEVGAKGKLLFFEEGVCKSTSLSRISNMPCCGGEVLQLGLNENGVDLFVILYEMWN